MLWRLYLATSKMTSNSEYAKEHIRFNAVAPGTVDTPSSRPGVEGVIGFLDEPRAPTDRCISLMEPVKKFKPTETLGVLVQLSEAKEGTKVKGVWTIVDAGGMTDKKIFEKKVELTPEAIKTAKDPSRIDFTLSHDNPYPTGDYKFEVYLNGELANTIEFKIEN